MSIKINPTLKICFLLTASVLCAMMFSTCKKSIVGEEFLGYWELEQYVIDGHDTTAYIKADSTCYGYTRFLYDEDKGANRLLQGQYYPVGLNFHCLAEGTWQYFSSTNILQLHYTGNYVLTGPYLIGGPIDWQIQSKTKDHISLFVMYENMPCYLSFNKKEF